MCFLFIVFYFIVFIFMVNMKLSPDYVFIFMPTYGLTI